MFGPEGKKDNSPKVSASAADDEKARLAAKYNSKENGHQGPGHSPATATVSSRGSSVDTDMRHERSLYEAAVSERDRNYFANTDHAVGLSFAADLEVKKLTRPFADSHGQIAQHV